MSQVNRHTVAILCDASALLKEIIVWGEASWWPKKSLMRFVRQTEGAVRAGTRYRQEVRLPFAPCWDVEVEQITQNSITRRFLNGMFDGHETISFSPGGARFEVVYQMHYRVQGFLNRFLWRLMFERLHNANIEAILKNLKEYLEKKK